MVVRVVEVAVAVWSYWRTFPSIHVHRRVEMIDNAVSLLEVCKMHRRHCI